MRIIINIILVFSLTDLFCQTASVSTQFLKNLTDYKNEIIRNEQVETIKTRVVFIGTVKEIKSMNFKEGKFDLIIFKVDTIIQLDTSTQIKNKIYLNKKRKRAFIMDEPSEHYFKIGHKYEVHVDSWNVDYYSSNKNLTKEI